MFWLIIFDQKEIYKHARMESVYFYTGKAIVLTVIGLLFLVLLAGLVWIGAIFFHSQIQKRTYLGQVFQLWKIRRMARRGKASEEGKIKMLKHLESLPPNQRIFLKQYKKLKV